MPPLRFAQPCHPPKTRNWAPAKQGADFQAWDPSNALRCVATEADWQISFGPSVDPTYVRNAMSRIAFGVSDEWQ